MKRALSVAVAFALVGCSDADMPTPPVAAPSVSFAVSDGAHGGNEWFYFLPPLVDNPSYTGEFNPNVLPSVDVCELGGGPDPECVATVRTFGYQEIDVELEGEHYHVGWNTALDDLDASKVYRITVRIGGTVLGFRDVDPVDSSDETPNDPLDDVYSFNNGSNIPIKFRIEAGALCDPDALECAEAAVFDGTGGTVAATSGGVFIDAFSLPGNDAVTVIVERIENLLGPGEECLPGLDLPQFGPCIRIRTEPELTAPLEQEAIVAICVDIELDTGLSHAQAHRLQIHRWDEDEPVNVQALPNVSEDICQGAYGLNGDGNFLSRALAALGSVFVRPLQAADRGLGGMVGSFSRFRWALPATLEVHDGDDQVALVGTDVPVPPAVLIKDEGGQPVKDARVHWTVTTGGGTVVPVVVYSDVDGIARVDRWTLGPTYGINTLEAWGFGISDGAVPYGSPHNSVTEPVDVDTGRVEFTALACVPGLGTPRAVDGAMESGEWDCAHQADFTANLSGGTAPATLYWMNDDQNLYLAVRVARDESEKVTSVRFDFDNDGNGIADAGEDAFGVDIDAGFFDAYLTDRCTNRSQSGCGEDDVADGGSTDGTGAIGHDGARLVYELSHPLDTGDAGHDFALAPGSTPGLYLTLNIGKGAKGNTQWPGFRDWMSITIQ